MRASRMRSSGIMHAHQSVAFLCSCLGSMPARARPDSAAPAAACRGWFHNFPCSRRHTPPLFSAAAPQPRRRSAVFSAARVTAVQQPPVLLRAGSVSFAPDAPACMICFNRHLRLGKTAGNIFLRSAAGGITCGIQARQCCSAVGIYPEPCHAMAAVHIRLGAADFNTGLWTGPCPAADQGQSMATY